MTNYVPCVFCFLSGQACQCAPRIRDTNHLFLELPLLKDKLEEYINKMSEAGSWSQNAIQVTNGWLKEGLRSRCITRDLKWGVPVPHEKFKDKVYIMHMFVASYSYLHFFCRLIFYSQVIFSFLAIDYCLLITCRYSMFGMMHQQGIFQSQHATHQTGRSGGRTLKMLSYINLWARIMCLSIL